MVPLTVKDIMRKVITVDASLTVCEATKIMDEKNIGSVLIVKNGEIIGILTERDVLRRVVAKGLDPWYTPVSQVMSFPLHTIDSNTDIITAGKIMSKHHIRRLPVIEKGKIIGIITDRDILDAVSRFQKAIEQAGSES